MKLLIVAHPDDEILWFSPQSFDLIVISFLARHDRPYARSCRELAIADHPLKDRITLLNIEESGFWKDNRRVNQLQASRKILNNSLLKLKKQFSFSEIFTHNSKGEYGHDDHILVNELVTSIFTESNIFSPVDLDNINEQMQTILIKNDLDFYLHVKEVYIKNKAWTWEHDYMPPADLYYSLHMSIDNDNC